MSKENVIGIARGELGVTEDPPGSNRTKYWEAYDPAFQGQPWCVCFLWWVFRQAGESLAFFGGGRTASCTRLLRWYREHGCTAAPAEAEAGDILLLNFRGGTEPEHCALAVKREGNVVFTIEGNTTPGWSGSQDNGGCVAEKARSLSRVVAVCRPPYAPETAEDAAGHWAESAIRWAVARGLMRGYPDGSFRPDRPVTRGELAAVLERLEESRQ